MKTPLIAPKKVKGRVSFIVLVCLWRIRRGEAVEAHAVVLVLIVAAFAVSLIQIRGAIFANMLSTLPLGFAFFALTLASVPAAWALAGAMLPGRSQQMLEAQLSADAEKRPSCIDETALSPLAREPAGVVAGASNLGAPILRHTGHRVLSAPYHRNQGGMLTELHIGLSNPRQAEAFLRGAHVTLLAFCEDDTQTADIARAEPQGLYADLFKGRVPDYLEPVAGTQASALRLYRVRPQ
jgi:hypothetical protein